jgi:hypothetical protein
MCVQLMYDQSGGGALLRQHCSINLGWWHTYKHVCLKVFQEFAPTVFAPLHHWHHPGTEFFKDTKRLMHVVCYFQMLLMSYKEVCDQVRTSVADVSLDPAIRVALQNFMFVCDFAIPTVPPQPTHSTVCGSTTYTGVQS